MKKRYWIIILVAALLLGPFFYFLKMKVSDYSDYERRMEQFDIEISQLLNKYPVSKSGEIAVKEYSVRETLDIESFKDRLKEIIKRSGFELIRYDIKYGQGKSIVSFEIGAKGKTFYALTFRGMGPPPKASLAPERPAVKIAIVIDDWGYNMNNIKLVDSIDIPLTISILPSLRYSTRIAKTQQANKDREVILHMPMEPEDKAIRLEENTLLVSMDKSKILTLLGASLKTVPYAKGLSNHMGSKATQDKGLVKVVMEELQRNKLYFLDSLATPDSICQQEAEGLKLKFVKRDVFLDNIADREYISSQMDKLIKLAKQRGFAVGVGHDRTLTLQVIKEKAQRLKSNEIEFVFASELASRRSGLWPRKKAE